MPKGVLLYGAPGTPGATGGLEQLNAFFLLTAAPETYNLPRQPSRPAGRVAPALTAGFATVAEHYERVLRTLQALGIELGIGPQDIGHPTDPEWGPATLLMYGDERFLKHEQMVIDQLLHRLP